MNLLIGRYQIFDCDFWIGLHRFEHPLSLILAWQLGLGFIRINKYHKASIK